MPKKRCACCNARTGLMSFSCSCNKEYCMKCRMPEEHKCTFDYKSKAKENLAKNNPLIVPSKVLAI